MKPRRVGTLAPRLRLVETRTAPPPAKRADEHYLTPGHRAWALAVKERAGWRCEWIEDGLRCAASRDAGQVMIADHIVEIHDGGAKLAIHNGQCLCTRHNTLKGIRARARRLGLDNAAARGAGGRGFNS